MTLMRRRHLRGVMAIERQVYSRPWSPNLFLAEMTEPNNRRYLVAKIDREIVGYAGLICYGDEGHVTNIAVDPTHQRNKVASRSASVRGCSPGCVWAWRRPRLSPRC